MLEARRVALRLRASTLLKEYEVMESDTNASPGVPRQRRSFPEQRGMSWEIPRDEQSSLAANVGVEQQRPSARVSSAWSLTSIARVPRPPQTRYERPAPPRATTAMLIATRRMLTETAASELAAVTALSRTFRSDRALQRTVAKVRRHCPERPLDVIATTLPGNDAEVHVAWTSGDDALDGTAIQSYAVEADPPLPKPVHLDAKESSVVVQTGGNAAAPGRTFVVVARTAAGYRSASRRVALTRSAEKLWVSLSKKRAAPAAAPKQKSALVKAKEEALAVGETFSPNPRLAAHFAQRAEYAKRAAAAAKAEKMRKAKVVVRRSPMGAAGGRRMLFDAYGQSVESVQQRVVAAEKKKREVEQRIEARVKSIEQGLKPQLPPPQIQVGRVRGDHLASRRVLKPAEPRPCVLDERGTTFVAREKAARTLSGARRGAASKSTKGEAQRDAERAERRRVELARRVAKAAAGNAKVAARRAKAAARPARTVEPISKASGPVRCTPAKTAAKKTFTVAPRAQPRERAERAGPPEQWRKDSRGAWIGTGNTQTHPKLKSTARAAKRAGAKRAAPKRAAGAGRDAYGRRRPVESAAPPTQPAADIEVEVEVAPCAVEAAVVAEADSVKEADAAAAAKTVAEAEAEAVAAAKVEAEAEAAAVAKVEAEAATAAAAKVEAEAAAEAAAVAAAKVEAEAATAAAAKVEAEAAAAAEVAAEAEFGAADVAEVESQGADDADGDGAAAPVEGAPQPERPADLFEGGGNYVGPLSDDSRDVMIFLAEHGECTWAAIDFSAPEEGSEEERGEAASKSKAHGTWAAEGDDLVLRFVSKTTTATGEEAVTEAFEAGSEERFAVPLVELRDPSAWRRA